MHRRYSRSSDAGNLGEIVMLSSATLNLAGPTLLAEDLRIDVDGVPACDGLTFTATGERILVLGAPRALFAAATGLAAVVRGALSVCGVPAARAASGGLIAGAAMDPPTPPRWTIRDYVEWSARLSGVSRADARRSATEAIDALQLGTMAKTPTGRLVPHARRATVVAAALATRAEIIALEDPLGGLPDEIADSYATVLRAALANCAWIIFAPRMPLTSPLALAADEAIVATASRIDAQGAPAEIAAAVRRFVGRVDGSAVAIAPLLEARGASVEDRGAHVVFDLGAEMTTSELMAICATAGVGVVELIPVARALV
jgi:ABC-type Na+ transport system ATPase subunit NatA